MRILIRSTNLMIVGVVVLIVLVQISATRADLTNGLVLYMPLDEGTGKVTKDVSTSKFEGELRGNAKWVDGKFGKALQFAASTDFVFIPDDEAFHITDAITQAAWIKLDRLPSAHAIIFGTRNAAAPNRKIGFGYGMDPDNNIKVWTNNPGGGFLDIDDTKTKLQPGEWYYLACTHQTDNNGLVEIYVNGELTHSQPSNNPVEPSGAPNEVTIGTWAGEAWPGIVDEVRLWNRILTADEIEESMDKGARQFTSVQPAGKLAFKWAAIKVQD